VYVPLQENLRFATMSMVGNLMVVNIKLFSLVAGV